MANTFVLDSHADGFEAKHQDAFRPSVLTRLMAALTMARHRSNERDIARFIAARGGALTDDMERELSRRFGSIVE